MLSQDLLALLFADCLQPRPVDHSAYRYSRDDDDIESWYEETRYSGHSRSDSDHTDIAETRLALSRRDKPPRQVASSQSSLHHPHKKRPDSPKEFLLRVRPNSETAEIYPVGIGFDGQIEGEVSNVPLGFRDELPKQLVIHDVLGPQWKGLQFDPIVNVGDLRVAPDSVVQSKDRFTGARFVCEIEVISGEV